MTNVFVSGVKEGIVKGMYTVLKFNKKCPPTHPRPAPLSLTHSKISDDKVAFCPPPGFQTVFVGEMFVQQMI